MHHIQRHILKLLIDNSSQRYSQLRPERVEPNQFVYHLKQLIGEGLVTKCDAGYELTAKGRNLADKLEPGKYEVAWDTKPRSAIFLALRNPDSEWLLVRRHRQPTIGKVGFIATDVTLDESIAQTARRYAQTEYGIEAGFSYVCSGSITLYRGSDLESFVVFHLMVADYDGTPENPAAAWYDPDELKSADVLPSSHPLIEILESSQNHFGFIELTHTLS